MFKIVGKQAGKFGVLDTRDGVTEFFWLKDIKKMAINNHIEVKGLKELLNYKSDIDDVAYYILRALKRISGYYQKSVEVYKDSVVVSVRDWGDWLLPMDADDEDARYQDYDWKELSPEYQKKLRELVLELNDKFYDMQFSWETSEKNWIAVTGRKI